MQIKIGWQNTNTTADGIRIYRSSSPIAPSSLPAPYDSIAGNATSYTDNSVIVGATYYYVVEVYKGTDSVFTTNIQATAAAYSGPGSQTLLNGDLDMGFYGIVQSSDFISWTALIAWSGITLGGTNPNATQDWLKFAFKGKTLFIPKQPVGYTTWNTLYSAGLVYGTNDNGPRDYNTLTAVNQLKIITVGTSQFKVRLPTSLPAGFDLTKDFVNGNTGSLFTNYAGSSNDSYDSNYDLSGSEWNDLFYKLFSWTPAGQRGENWLPPLDTAMAYNSSTSWTGLISDSIFQELVAGPKHLTRGILGAGSASYHPGKTNTLAPTTQAYWRPVLEMI